MNKVKDIVKSDRINCAGNHYAIFLHCKLEKITTAIYMVTDFFPEEEPLRLALREKSIQLMSFVMSLTKGPSSLDENIFFEITSLITEIDSFLRISLNSNLVSGMNYSVLIGEYKNFLDLITERKKTGVGRKILLTDDFFKDDEKNEVVVGPIAIGQKTKGHSQKSLNKDIPTNMSFIKNKSTYVKKEKPDRKNMILKVVKDKKQVTIRDISKVIKGCSEKTIQRELIAMVKDNTLKKEGERRWSHYSLK